ncbi:MAG: hypothetical protein H6742_15345 [Alphaproteobacteria bacterium]|nr:hypothetical protein [Alphaproteobacteria bacterium]
MITKAGEKGIINVVKLVPLAGVGVGGAIDAVACVGVGKPAKGLFER